MAGWSSATLRKARQAREALRKIPCDELIQRMKKAAELFLHGALPMGDGQQSPEDFVRAQSATTGLPEAMCRANMHKNNFVLSHMDQMLDALTRGLDLSVLSNGYGIESRGVVVSYQAQADAVGLVLPSNSPGVHTLWLPIIPMQIGLRPQARDAGTLDRRIAWPPPLSRPAFLQKRSRSIPAATMWAVPSWPIASGV